MKIASFSPAETKKIAALLAEEIKKTRNRTTALVVGLEGNLGAGKTTFIQGFARALGIGRRLLSPTFLIIRSYKLKTTNYKLLFHVDCYRLKKPKELAVLGLGEILADPKNIAVIEWADKIKRVLPRKTFWIKLEHGKRSSERIIEIDSS